MLKTLKPDTFAGVANAKCGEIFFQSLNSFRIDCLFCDMKCFIFDDFLLHIQNIHFENGLLKTDAMQKLQQRETKQEVTDSPASEGIPFVAQVNPFVWYGNEKDEDPGADDNVAEDQSSDEESEEESDVKAIMKWNQFCTRDSLRPPRALKVDYKEEEEESYQEEDGSEAETKEQLPEQDQSNSCPHCEKKYQSKTTLDRHLAQQHKTLKDSPIEMTKLKFKCQHCDKIYKGKYSLRQHVKRDHVLDVKDEETTEGQATATSSSTFTCLECHKELPRLRLLDEHMFQMHGGALCPICQRRYKTRHELKRHQLNHTNERNVICSFAGCEKRFFSRRHMRNHMKVHSEQKNFVCENCGYSCRNKETLRVHMRSHTGERPFGCQVCSKRFPSHSGLREHMAMHSTERPYVCTVCGATFSRQKGLYHHKFLHSATKQFVCKLCGNAYAQAAGLAGHMRKHRNDELNG
ncbi:zinc finger protein 782 [Drosophila willistoni]|uniref:zinc finger protein 782 n=1 Tax=Drosophila willistoni TaxID=7260 RepID=UPI001F084073|nr:zinc finger protein 782 [Drosophila willistoni]